MAIEKFSGKFTNEANGCTTLINSTIQNITDLNVLGLYTYLCSKPDSWEPNYKEIMNHFKLTKTTTYKYLNKMIELGLMSRKEVREKGRFSYTHYFVHLRPIEPFPKKWESVEDHINIDVSPFPKKWDPVQPETVIPETYKTKINTKQRLLEKKENPPISRKRDCAGEDDLKLTPREKGTNPRAMGMFDSFWELYPSKKAKKKCMEIWKRRKLDSIAPLILDNLRKQVDGDDTWKRGFVPNPSTYLNQDRWEDEISSPKPDLRQDELERKKLANEKRLVDQERISEQTRKYENEKFKEMNKDGKAFRELSKAVRRGDTKPPPEFSALKESLLKGK